MIHPKIFCAVADRRPGHIFCAVADASQFILASKGLTYSLHYLDDYNYCGIRLIGGS